MRVWRLHRPLGGSGVTWPVTIKKQSSQETAAGFYWKEIKTATEQWSNVGGHSTGSAKLQITLSCNVFVSWCWTRLHQQETRISCQHTGQPLNLKPRWGWGSDWEAWQPFVFTVEATVWVFLSLSGLWGLLWFGAVQMKVDFTHRSVL